MNRTPIMLHSFQDDFCSARESAVLIKQTTGAKRIEIWRAGTLELLATIESKK